MNSSYKLPVNLGNPHEFTIGDFAKMVQSKVTEKQVAIKQMPPVVDDPRRRKPDITRAKKELNWEPQFSVEQGVEETIEYFKLLLLGNV
jgi:UDP-glucuronate decarboxylase